VKRKLQAMVPLGMLATCSLGNLDPERGYSDPIPIFAIATEGLFSHGGGAGASLGMSFPGGDQSGAGYGYGYGYGAAGLLETGEMQYPGLSLPPEA
jgi:hypothetical protein